MLTDSTIFRLFHMRIMQSRIKKAGCSDDPVRSKVEFSDQETHIHFVSWRKFNWFVPFQICAQSPLGFGSKLIKVFQMEI